MADSARLSMTPTISEPDSSTQHSYTFITDSDDGLRRPGPIGCGTWLDPSQAACQYTSDHQPHISSSLRMPALSHENSDDEYSHDPIRDSESGTRQDSMVSSRQKFQFICARGYSRITKQPHQSRNFQPGKLLNRCRNHSNSQPETVIELPTRVNILKLWKWEVFGCVLAIGMLGSMYSILLHYDSQRRPDWGSAINLSTLIALMATILRTMLAFVVSEIIGQAKWTYFNGGGRQKGTAPVRRLIETSRFNDASQGLLGAFKLLPSIIWDPATLMAVMVMIVSLGTGSFVQQAIQTQSCQFPVDSAHASVPISQNITASKEGKYGTEIAVTSNVFAAVSSALTPENDDIGSPISVGCRTGNCTFRNSIGGLYSTLGMCSSCADTSSLITTTEWASTRESTLCASDERCPQFNVTLPNGMSVLDHHYSNHYQTSELLVSSERGLDWAGDLTSQDMKALSEWALANITILTPTWLPTSSGYSEYVATSCTLYPCLRSYTGSVRSGKLDEVLVDTVPAVPDVADRIGPNLTSDAIQEALLGLVDFKAVQSPCLVNDTVWTKEEKSSTLDLQRLVLAHAVPDPGGARRFIFEDITAPAECIFSLEANAAAVLSIVMMYYSFNGSCDFRSGTGAGGFGGRNYAAWINCQRTFWLTSFFDKNGTTAASIINRIEAFADRLSNKMRMGLFNNPNTVSGQVLEMTVCSRIHYSWLAFPAVLVAVTSGLLAWTMFQSSRRRGREMVWKTSILPFLFYGEQFVIQNGEDMSADSTESLRRDEGTKEPLLDLDQMEAEARQRIVRFDVFN